jgi:hypothetical protein
MTAIFAALCLRPSATTPPPIGPLLKTKAKVQFDRAVTERSKAIFPIFQGSNRGQFQPCFCVFTVRSAEGRNAVRVAVLGWTAECYLLIAIFSKILGRYVPIVRVISCFVRSSQAKSCGQNTGMRPIFWL